MNKRKRIGRFHTNYYSGKVVAPLNDNVKITPASVFIVNEGEVEEKKERRIKRKGRRKGEKE